MKNLIFATAALLFVHCSFAQETNRKDLVHQIFNLIGERDEQMKVVIDSIAPVKVGGFDSYQLNDQVSLSYFSNEGMIEMISLTIELEDEARLYFNEIHDSAQFIGQKLAAFYHEKNGVYSAFSKQPQTGKFNILFSRMAP